MDYLKTKMLKNIISVFILSFCITSAFGQGFTVTGTVTDETGDLLPGATVIVRGTGNAAVTDGDGRFTLNNVTADAVLQISFVGFTNREITVGSERVFNVQLGGASVFDELVVVGYGVQRRANLTGAVTTIDSRVLEDRPITTVSNAIQGLLPGVIVLSGEGRPGQEDATIRVRGVGTLNVDQAGPYILIDGVEAGNLNSLDPNDIESITVLRDAAAAAIYGSRAANGVILITTKRGTTGTPTITYSGFIGLHQPTNMIERLSSYDYARLLNELRVEAGQARLYDDNDLQLFRDGSSPYTHPNTDWYALAFKLGVTHQHNISVRGGSDRARYMTSFGFLDQQGILPNSSRTQFNARTNLDLQVTDRINIRMNMSFIQNNSKDPTNSFVGGGSDQIIRQLNIISPMIVGRYPEGHPRGPWGTAGGDGSPIAWLDVGQTQNRNIQNFSGLLATDIQIFEGLRATIQGSYTGNTQHRHEFRHDIQYNPIHFHRPSRLDEIFFAWNRYTFDAFLNYEIGFGNHGIHVLAGWHAEKYHYRENGMARTSFPDNSLTDMSAGAAAGQTNRGFTRDLAMVSGFGRINYNYDNRYLLEANFRADASSRFAPQHRWGYFPAFSAGWRVSGENFMLGTRSWLNNLMIRGSWGLLGDQQSDDQFYPWINTYNISSNYPIGGTLRTGYAMTAFRIESFSWERSRTYGFGIDANLLNGVDVSIDYYDRLTSDIIMQVPVPQEFGLGAYHDNVGSVLNRGIEIALGYNRRWGDFSFGSRVMFTYNHNEIIDLGFDAEGNKVEQIIDGRRIRRVGEEIDSWFLFQDAGLLRSPAEVDAFLQKYDIRSGGRTTMFTQQFQPGDIRYVGSQKGENGEYSITAADRVVVGKSHMPKYVFGINLNFGYRQFDLSALFSGQLGAARIYSQETYGTFVGDVTHPSTWWLDAWTPDNPNSNVPRRFLSNNSNSCITRHASTFWLQSTNFLRLKNLQLGYSLPRPALNALNISRLRVFYSVENLFTIDSMPINLDPETSSERASSFPLIKTHSFGINLTF